MNNAFSTFLQETEPGTPPGPRALSRPAALVSVPQRLACPGRRRRSASARSSRAWSRSTPVRERL